MLLQSIIDLIMPRFCVVCHRRLYIDEGGICLHCNISLPRTYHWQTPSDNTLYNRFLGRLDIVKAASYFYFVPKSATASIMYAFKYKHDKRLACNMGRLMASEMSDTFFSDIDYLVPIPITKARRLQRRYNQSEEIAKGIHKVTGIATCFTAVRRNVDSFSQTTLSRFERADNIRSVFYLTDDAWQLEGKHILLIDDVITSGATTIECGKQLLRIPNIRISILSLGCVRS